MFVGHYGVSFAIKRIDRSIPLWVLFVAVQLLDVFWAPFILLGIEKARIVPGFTESNALDLYYMPYTHGLIAAALWSAAAYAVYRMLGPGRGNRAALLVGLAVFSHWILDLIVHVRDLPLYDNTAKVGLGLWNRPVLAFLLEAALLFGAIAWLLRIDPRGKKRLVVFGLVMLGIQASTLCGPPPSSERVTAIMALSAYALFAAVIAWWERTPGSHGGPASRGRAPTRSLA